MIANSFQTLLEGLRSKPRFETMNCKIKMRRYITDRITFVEKLKSAFHHFQGLASFALEQTLFPIIVSHSQPSVIYATVMRPRDQLDQLTLMFKTWLIRGIGKPCQ